MRFTVKNKNLQKVYELTFSKTKSFEVACRILSSFTNSDINTSTAISSYFSKNFNKLLIEIVGTINYFLQLQ